jgi:hypothetical protein
VRAPRPAQPSTLEWWLALTDAERAEIDRWSRESRRRRGLPECLPPEAIARVRPILEAALLADANRSAERHTRPAGPDATTRRARRQALLGGADKVMVT